MQGHIGKQQHRLEGGGAGSGEIQRASIVVSAGKHRQGWSAGLEPSHVPNFRALCCRGCP